MASNWEELETMIRQHTAVLKEEAERNQSYLLDKLKQEKEKEIQAKLTVILNRLDRIEEKLSENDDR